MLTPELLKQCLPESSDESVQLYAHAIESACEEFEINTPQRLAAFLAQICHESGNLKSVRENLNYSSDGLQAVFPKYFNVADAKKYHRNPENIANRVYANRMGNGSEESGDGWKYCGRGLIQLTGKTNYDLCGAELGFDLINDPSYLQTPEGAARSAAWFWKKNRLNELADTGDMKSITKRINGGYIGLENRINHYEHAKVVLNV